MSSSPIDCWIFGRCLHRLIVEFLVIAAAVLVLVIGNRQLWHLLCQTSVILDLLPPSEAVVAMGCRLLGIRRNLWIGVEFSNLLQDQRTRGLS
jgi:hypothetical protein